ncbi:MAG: NAD(P)/FAD-dependent oxidoreductase [Vicinamibacteria bacterium]
MPEKRHRVVIIGGGFGGLTAARRLRRAPFEVFVLDRTNHHLFQPLLYQVAAAALSPGDIARPIREVLRHQRNATVLLGEVTGIHKQDRTVELRDGEPIAYDYLVVATGARHHYFGHPDWERHAPGIKTLRDAIRIRELILGAFEKAERSAGSEGTEGALSFVVVGGGPTGVELAGAIAEIAHQTMVRDFRRIDPTRTKVYLLEAASRMLPGGFDEELARKAQEQLERLGVQVMLNTRVTDVQKGRVEHENGVILADAVLWAAGNQASPLIEKLGVPVDRQGRAIVQEDLTLPGHPEIFVIGDAAHVKDRQGNPLPAVATVAIQQGKYVGKILRKGIVRRERPPFRFRDWGMMATIGKAKAIAVIGPLRLSGRLAWLAWCFVHILYLIGFRNRLMVMLEWMFWYYYRQPSARLLSGELSRD